MPRRSFRYLDDLPLAQPETFFAGRHCRILALPTGWLVNVFGAQTQQIQVLQSLPEDTKCVWVGYETMSGHVLLGIEHPSFDAVAGDRIEEHFILVSSTRAIADAADELGELLDKALKSSPL